MKYLYSIKRKVIAGNKIARTFYFPTANLRYYKRDKKLENGVYIVKVGVDKNILYGLAFVGTPQIIKKSNKRIEIFIFKYRGNLYSKVVKVNFLRKLRGVKNFKDIKSLKAGIKKDIAKAEKFLENPIFYPARGRGLMVGFE